jgi:creatinine amidohydrolase
MSDTPYNLEQAHWRDIRDLPVEVAILPWGATEPHNYHLPFGSDTIQSEYIALESASIASGRGAGVMVLPAVPWGVNTGQTDLKFCLNMMPSTQLALLGDLADNLVRHRIPKLVIINSHGGNDFIPIIRELSVRSPELFICVIDWWKICKGEAYFDEPGDHAGELETSVMMAIQPGMVLPLSEAGDGRSRKFAPEGLNSRWAWAQRSWSIISDSTGVGNPAKATREKGERFLRIVIEKVSSFLADLASTPLSEIYEKEPS